MKIRNMQILIGVGSTIVFLVLAFYRVPLGAVRAALADVNPLWLAAAILVYAANLSLRSWRWQIILRAGAPVSYAAVARALVVGYGLNAILPARLGELVRAEFCKKEFGLPRPWALASIVIERLFDGLMVIACLGIGLVLAAAAQRQSDILTKVAAVSGLLFGGGFVVLLALSRSILSRALSRFPRLSEPARLIEQGFQLLHSRRVIVIAVATLIVYLPDTLSLWLIVKAVGLGLGLTDTLILVGAISLSTLLPSGPAFLGTLQFAYALVIGFAGAPPELGIAAATLAQLFVLLPLALVAASVLAQRSGKMLFATPRKDRSPHLHPGLL